MYYGEFENRELFVLVFIELIFIHSSLDNDVMLTSKRRRF